MKTQKELDHSLTMLREMHHADSYLDYADMCNLMKDVCTYQYHYCLELDDVERENVKNLETLLDVCSKMFVNCDPYYRRR